MTLFLERLLLPITHVLVSWLVVVGCTCAIYAGVHDTGYFRIGPSPSVFFLGFALDTWGKWGQVVGLVAVSQVIYMVTMESISPWIMNTVMDPKATRIPLYSYLQVQYICNVYYIFAAVVQLLQVQIVVAQADLAAVVVVVDCVVSLVTTHIFVKSKEAVGVDAVLRGGGVDDEGDDGSGEALVKAREAGVEYAEI